MKLRNKIINEIAENNFSHITTNIAAGFDACEAEYLPIIEKLESALKYTMRDGNRPFLTLDNQQQINEALAELEQFKKKMNGENK